MLLRPVGEVNAAWRTKGGRLDSPLVVHHSLCANPAAAHDRVAVIKDSGLARGDGALRLVESDQDLIRTGGLDQGWSGLVPVADLDRDPHRFAQLGYGNQVDAVSPQGAGVELLVGADDYLLSSRP